MTIKCPGGRRLFVYGGCFTARSRVTKRSSWPVRIYLKRWQAEICVMRVGVYSGWILLPPLAVLHPSIEAL